MTRDRNTELAQLHKDFPSTSVVQESTQETLLKIDHRQPITATTSYALSLFVRLLASFPSTPPTVTMPYCHHTVPITPPNVSPSELKAYEWDPKVSTLTQAVQNAFQNAADCWGSVEPPSMQGVMAQLSGETDRLLRDIVGNPNCLDAYCYQLPMVKSMREAGRQTVTEVERVANENTQLRPEVEDLQRRVQLLQQQLTQQVSQLQQLSQNKLLAAVCTPEALLRTLEKDIQAMSSECAETGRSALDAHGTNKGVFQDKLSQYKAQAKAMHMLDLKRISYRAQRSGG